MADKELMRLSREEIAKQFQLPERKSKIATLLKQDGQAYCICRSSDSSRFMIGCDSCEEWYHGDCIGLTEKDAKFIRQFYCVRCQEEDPSLETLFKPGVKPELEARFCSEGKTKRKRERLADITATSAHAGTLPKQGPQRHTNTNVINKRSCGQCTNCFRTRDCGDCRVCRSGRSKDTCLNRICFKFSNKGFEKEKKVQTVKATTKSSNARRKRKESESDTEKNSEPLRQCNGPGCMNAARPRSKYCCDNCGIQLATNRIFQVLPQRIQEWALSPCLAEEMNKKELESVRKQQLEIQSILQELRKRHYELDAIIDRAKHATIDEHADDEADEEIEMSMYCITCGHEIHSRTAIKHMEKCFNKYESQASFGSIYKTRIEDSNMFCDFFNPSNKTYCKRLRVLCPEHCKDPKINEKEVCGCPLVTNVFDLTGEFCRASKKTCIKHYCWEKLRRAEIDMERVRQWLKIDELIEQERQIRQRMADRAGVLALMLHSTYNHDLMEHMARNATNTQNSKINNNNSNNSTSGRTES